MNFILMDENGQQIVMARDLPLLQREYRQKINELPEETLSDSVTRKNITTWDFETLPVEVSLPRGKMSIKAWPSLVDYKDSVSIELTDNPLIANASSMQGQLRLALIRGREQVKYVSKNLLKGKDLDIKAAGLSSRQELVDSITAASFEQAMFDNGVVIRDKDEFHQAFDRGIGLVIDLCQQRADAIASVLKPLHHCRKSLRALGSKAANAKDDIDRQIAWLFSSDTVQSATAEDIKQYPRFFKALELRIEKLASQISKDQAYTATMDSFVNDLEALQLNTKVLTTSLRYSVLEFRWLLEELRVSLFAQQLKTRQPVSIKRIEKKWSALTEELDRLI